MDVDPPGTDEDIPFSAELARKLLHLVTVALPVAMWFVGRTWAIAIVVPLALMALTADVLRARSRSFSHFINRFLGFMMRNNERPPVGGPVVINGATWVLVSAALLVVVFPLVIATQALAVFLIADAAAAVVGRRWGRRRWPRSRRTLEGSSGFFVVAIAGLSVFGTFSFVAVLGAAIAGTVVEALPRPLNDNLRVPFIMALLLYFL